MRYPSCTFIKNHIRIATLEFRTKICYTHSTNFLFWFGRKVVIYGNENCRKESWYYSPKYLGQEYFAGTFVVTVTVLLLICYYPLQGIFANFSSHRLTRQNWDLNCYCRFFYSVGKRSRDWLIPISWLPDLAETVMWLICSNQQAPWPSRNGHMIDLFQLGCPNFA